jgi:hypothetical protein
MKNIFKSLMALLIVTFFLASCDKNTDDPIVGVNPDTAEKQSIDRFAVGTGMLMVRDATNGLPAANAAINFDQAPFITHGLTAAGSHVSYYNFDVMSTTPAPIFVPMINGVPVDGQLNIIDKIPGDLGYNDFWQVNKVDVPADFVANSITSFSDIVAKGYTVTAMPAIVNCPVVPVGSTASMRVGGGTNGLIRGWYKGKVVSYFTFEEKALTGTSVPTSPIYVMFNINPDQPNGGPGSGFIAETGTDQTHNVLATVPADAAYSPLWSVNVINNADFNTVSNLSTAQSANIMAMGVALVNCPVAAQ